MGEILGVGCTHRPVMLRRNEDWTFMMKASLDDPAMPDEMKNPARWPAPLREELGNDWGASAAARAREVYRRHFAEARQALDDFKPDLIVMWGDDQYENFKEDIVPAVCVLAYERPGTSPGRTGARPTTRGTSRRQDLRVRGHREAGKYLASRLLEAGIDIAYAYQPSAPPGWRHAFENTLFLLDDERLGFDYPLRAVPGQLLRPAGHLRAGGPRPRSR